MLEFLQEFRIFLKSGSRDPSSNSFQDSLNSFFWNVLRSFLWDFQDEFPQTCNSERNCLRKPKNSEEKLLTKLLDEFLIKLLESYAKTRRKSVLNSWRIFTRDIRQNSRMYLCRNAIRICRNFRRNS